MGFDEEAQKVREENEVKNLVTTDVLNFIPGIGFAMDAIDVASGVYDGFAGETARERSDGWSQATMGALGMLPIIGTAMDVMQLSHDAGRAQVYDETGVVEPSFEENWANDRWAGVESEYKANAPAVAQKNWPQAGQCEAPESEWQPGYNNVDQQCDAPEDMLFYGMY